MTGEPDRFSDDEVRLLLARAVERQEGVARTQLTAKAGLTLPQLQEIAAEVGVEPSHVESAARELVLRRERGLPMPLEIDRHAIAHVRVLDGAVDDSAWERLVHDLRDTFGVHGSLSTFGAAREWASGDQGSDGRSDVAVRIRVEPDGDRAAVTMRADLRSVYQLPIWFGGGFGAFAAITGSAMGLGLAPSAAPGLPAVLAGLAAGVWFVFRRVAQATQARTDARFRAVLDRFELDILRRAAVPPRLPTADANHA